MAYNKKTWISNEIISKDALNNIENGIEAVEQNIPKKISQLENDSGYIAEHQDLSSYAKKDEIFSKINTQNGIVSIEEFGIQEGYDIDVEENTRRFQEMIDYCKNEKVICFPAGNFVFKGLDLGEKNNITIKGVSSPFASFAQKNIYTGEIKNNFTRIICDMNPGETFFNHKSCVLILEDISFYNLEKNNDGTFSEKESKKNILMQHTRSEDAGKNTEKGKAFCLNCGFFGWKVVFGSDFTMQHLENALGTQKVEEDYEYFKQSCVLASKCRFTRNGVAINQSVDGRIVDCSFNKNDYAIILRENSGFTTISNCRIEWNNFNGIYCEKAHEVTVSNCEFDCNGLAGLYAVENTCSNFNGIFRRSGAQVPSQDDESHKEDYINNVHIYAKGNIDCNFIGSNTNVKPISDVGSAPERPSNVSCFENNTNCIIASNNLRGCTKSDKVKANKFLNNINCVITSNMLNELEEYGTIHEHNNKDVLDQIDSARIQAWDSASVGENVDLSNYVTKETFEEFVNNSIEHIFITKAEYEALSEEDKNKKNVLYLITDGENAIINLDNYITKDVEWQKYKLTNDDGKINYITTNNLDIMTMEPGNYACVSSRFINPPLPENDGYVDLTIRANTNSSGTRYVYTMHYIYHGRTFVGYKHHEHDYIHWEEITKKSLPVQEYIDSEVNRIMKRLREYHTSTSRNIGFITDTHYVKGARGKNSRRGLDHIENCISICGNGAADMIVHGGDIINGGYSSVYALQTQLLDTNHAMLNSPVPIFPCKGNHDSGLVWSITSGKSENKFDDVYITNKEWCNLVSNRFIKKYGFVGDSDNPYNTYCYYDFDDIKLRCIMLDTEDLEKEHLTDADGNIVLDEEDGSMVFRIGPKQLNWLANVALNFDSKNDNWSVMLFSHVTIYSPYTENATRITNGKHIHQILKAFKEHNSYSCSVDGTSITCDFTGENHKVIAGIAGHYHSDLVLVKDDILYITCKQSRCDYNVYTDPSNDDEYRALGDPEHEDCWTIFTVDPAKRQVVLTRFGSGKNYEQVFKLDELSDTTVFPGDTESENDNDVI